MLGWREEESGLGQSYQEKLNPGKPVTSEKAGAKGSGKASSFEMSLHGSSKRQGKVGTSGTITQTWGIR